MNIRIGNAPCSWGVEFADDPRNPNWQTVLDECAAAGFKGIELGPIGFLPDDPIELAEALSKRDLELIGSTLFRPFHDPGAWDSVWDAAVRTCKALNAHNATHLVLIDSIAQRRAATAGRENEAAQMNNDEWAGFAERLTAVVKLGAQEYGLTVSIHAHAGGFCDFRPELERLLTEVEPELLKICLDTGHAHYAGYNLDQFMDQHMDRISYMHFKDIEPSVKARVIENHTGFYDACAEGIFCTLGSGEVDFLQVRKKLLDAGFQGWCTIEQDCDPLGATSPLHDAMHNRNYLESIGFHRE